MNREIKKDQYNSNCHGQGFLGVALKTLKYMFFTTHKQLLHHPKKYIYFFPYFLEKKNHVANKKIKKKEPDLYAERY